MFDEQWTIQAVRDWGDWQLEPYIQDDVERAAQLDYLLTGLMDWNYNQLANNLNTILEDEVKDQFIQAVKAIKQGQPVQYALGHAAFFGREFKVDGRVLIPRQETEELVDWILRDQAKRSGLKVLDLGTGSGAIGVTLGAERPDFDVTLSDISAEALEVAQENAQTFGVPVKTIQSDLFAKIPGQYDVIVSNPPYISEAERPQMDASVLAFEPAQALFAADEGLALYKAIANELLVHLTVHGVAYFELGYQQGAALETLFKALPDVEVTLRQDMSGHDRMLRVVKGGEDGNKNMES
ncbi:release factor glutamine methyltransferase [Weissella uvarum]|uniref:peptide chain release factor N(5)-glutamine methyltransferase n=1 Tax=Weissella uvarum TaxID=1479233 RepID=UPI0019602A81|nr:peptide chain release factor N(5)-glutamine methyltransferase [Weissella uvarum]MBM7616831.1 release factor glutamine methyltransferase [Weissella uvarum]MCM0594717.1 peptide chain release factor N(5)-glutamine methyltransferase [Weissella uvarum]